MTPEQLEKKRETARRNGAKSRGPVTAAGKQSSRLNPLRHGRYVDRSLMPPTYVILSVEVQEGFAQELKNNTRQFQVATETQAQIVRQLTSELWMYNRLGLMLCALDQKNFDKAFREFPDYENYVTSAAAAENMRESEKIYRSIERRRAGHLKAWQTFVRMINHLQKHHSRAPRDPEVREPIQAEAQLEAEAEIWNEPIEQDEQIIENEQVEPDLAETETPVEVAPAPKQSQNETQNEATTSSVSSAPRSENATRIEKRPPAAASRGVEPRLTASKKPGNGPLK
jgi:hypothetical protein